MKITLWATNLAAPLASLDEWIARVEEKLVVARAEGSSLLVMPEYACAQWLALATDLTIKDEVAWLAEHAAKLLPSLAALAEKHGIGLLPGTMPIRNDDGSFANRAALLLPTGAFYQDKLALTPLERDPNGWVLHAGSTIRIVRWGEIRLAIAICFDVEVPALAARLCALDIDLLIVPSQTSSLAGYGRVFGCAKARAIELSCPVAVVGNVGTLVLSNREDENVSGAAVFVPCEPDNELGVVASIGPFAEDDGEGPMLHADLPIDNCRFLRRGNSEVWPPRLHANVSIEETSIG